MMAVVGLFVRLYVLKTENQFPVNDYLVGVILPLIPTTVIISIVQLFLKCTFNHPTLLAILSTMFVGVIFTCFIIYFVGLNKQERLFIRSNISVLYNKFTR